MKTTAERMAIAMNERGITQSELCARTKIGKSSISTYLSGEYEPKQRNLYKIAAALDVSEAWLMGYDVPMERISPMASAHDVGRVVSFRVINAVKCGYDCAPMEDFTDEIEQLPADMLNGYSPSDCKVLRVSGNSMYPRIIEGDKVLVHLQPDVESGETAVVLCSCGEEATLKKIVKHKDYIELIPANPEYETKRISGSDLKDCRIYGRVIKLIRDF